MPIQLQFQGNKPQRDYVVLQNDEVFHPTRGPMPYNPAN